MNPKQILRLEGQACQVFAYLEALARFKGDTTLGKLTSPDMVKFMLWGSQVEPLESVDFSKN